jgi:hypothetical protein
MAKNNMATRRPICNSHANSEISTVSVKAALDTLLRYNTQTVRSNSLEHLCLVDEALTDPTTPPSIRNRALVLSQILTSIITDLLANYRAGASNKLSPVDTSINDALLIIQLDTASTNPELIGLSWLYYHYVRIDLNISVALFCRVACFNERTLRRYQSQALWCLTKTLAEMETAAWKKIRTHRLSNCYSEKLG